MMLAYDPCDEGGSVGQFLYGGPNVGVGLPGSLYGAIELAAITADSLDDITGLGWYAGGALASPAGGAAATYAAPFFWQDASYSIISFGYARGAAANVGVGASYTKRVGTISFGSLSATSQGALRDAQAKAGIGCDCGQSR